MAEAFFTARCFHATQNIQNEHYIHTRAQQLLRWATVWPQ